jgi:hypothetical protein
MEIPAAAGKLREIGKRNTVEKQLKYTSLRLPAVDRLREIG